MAILNDETDEWQDGIYQLETTDPVVGGVPIEGTGAGMDNIPHLQLARRTRWLKAAFEALNAVVENFVPTTRQVNTSGLATGGGDLTADRTITVPKASTAEAVAGTDDDKAVTPLGLARAIEAQMPRWRVSYDLTATRIHPSAIVSAHAGYYGDYPSRGSIIGATFRRRDGGTGGSYLFEMTLNAAAAATVRQYIAHIDDALYAYCNGALVRSVATATTEAGEIEWPLIAGDNLLQIVVNDNDGDNHVLSLVGDLLSQAPNLTFVPM